jgi:hypothetical protein
MKLGVPRIFAWRCDYDYDYVEVVVVVDVDVVADERGYGRLHPP